MLIAMAGLPATGKSTLAHALAQRLDGVLLDKDQIRAALFRPEDIEYSDEQNDLCLSVMFQVAAFLLKQKPERPVIFDGRTYSKFYQVRDLVRFAAETGADLRIIECVTSDEIARQRLEADVTAQAHVAANRSYALYQALKAQADPIEEPKLVIDTSQVDLPAALDQALDYILAH